MSNIRASVLGARVGGVALHALQARRSRRCSRAPSAAGRGRARRTARPCAPAPRAAARRRRCRRRACVPGVGRDQPGEHAQRRRLAGAVRAEQAGDAAVGRAEADVAHRVHDRAAPRRCRARAAAEPALARRRGDERLGDAARPRSSARSEPCRAARSGRERRRPRHAWRRSRRRPPAPRRRRRHRRSGSTTSRMQPIAITPWPALATTTCRAMRPERRGDALAVARRRRRIDAAAQHQRRRRRSAAACRTPPAPRRAASRRRRFSYMRGERGAEVGARLVGAPRPGAARPRRRRPRSACPSASRSALRDAAGSRSGRPGLRSRRAPPSAIASRQRGGERRRVERAAHRAEQHLARQREALVAPGQRMRRPSTVARQALQQRGASRARRSGCASRARRLGGAGRRAARRTPPGCRSRSSPAAPCRAARRRRARRAAPPAGNWRRYSSATRVPYEPPTRSMRSAPSCAPHRVEVLHRDRRREEAAGRRRRLHVRLLQQRALHCAISALLALGLGLLGERSRRSGSSHASGAERPVPRWSTKTMSRRLLSRLNSAITVRRQRDRALPRPAGEEEHRVGQLAARQRRHDDVVDVDLRPRSAVPGSSGRLTLPHSTPLRKPATWHSRQRARRRVGAPARRAAASAGRPPRPRPRRASAGAASSFAERFASARRSSIRRCDLARRRRPACP